MHGGKRISFQDCLRPKFSITMDAPDSVTLLLLIHEVLKALVVVVRDLLELLSLLGDLWLES